MLKSKIIKFFALLFIISALDYSLSNLFFKSKSFWKYEKLTDFYWRIPSKEYHHDLLPNIDVIEPWGFSLSKNLITNSIGFRDFSNREVKKISSKKRLLLIGDSAIEGAGYDYEHTLGGLLQNNYKGTFEVLNSAVGSYSPSIYFKKIKFFINEGYKFDEAIIFLDPSDVIDELFIKWDNNENILINEKDLEKNRKSKKLL